MEKKITKPSANFACNLKLLAKHFKKNFLNFEKFV